MAEEETVVITQKEGDALALRHDGGVALYGDARHPALKHNVGGAVELVHSTVPKQPLVHMVCWDEDRPCEISGRVALVGDESAPLQVKMNHHFENPHEQAHRIETRLAEPIHHALQMRTPLQLRFCNPWHIASDYVMEIRMGKTPLISVRLTGATVATPQPCEEEPCPPTNAHPGHP